MAVVLVCPQGAGSGRRLAARPQALAEPGGREKGTDPLSAPGFWLLVFHGGACLAVGAVPGVSASRRVLATVLILSIPLAGPLLAAMALLSRGRGARKNDLDAGLDAEPRRLSAADARRLSDRLPTVDLLASDPESRREALAELSNAADPAAVDALRFSVEHGEAELVLEAALTLDELVRSAEDRRAALRRRVVESPSFERALEAADAASEPILTGLADPALHGALAAEARSFYALAASLAPEQTREIGRRCARLELAVRRPLQALEALEGDYEADAEALRAEAAFAARRFELLSRGRRTA